MFSSPELAPNTQTFRCTGGIGRYMSAKLARFICLIVMMGSIASLVACGGSSSGSGSPTLTNLAVTPSSASLPKGTTRQLAVKGTYSNGTSKDLTGQVSWSVSPSSVAKVSNTGLLTTLVQGNATVTATMAAVAGHVSLTVQPAAITAIQISPPSLSIPMGKGQQLLASASYTDGTSGDVTNSVNWSTTPAAVATVNSSGMLQSLSKGNFSVTAASGSITKSLNGTVGNPVIQALQVLPTSAAIPKGTTQSFTASRSE